MARPDVRVGREGCLDAHYAAAEPQLAGVTGRFFFKSKVLATKPVTHDSGVAARLWSISEELCGLSTTAPHTELPAAGLP
jgi:hypothetical protein